MLVLCDLIIFCSLDEDDSDSDGTKPGKRWSEIDKEYLGKVD